MIQSTIKFSQIEDRLDAEYYKHEYTKLRALLKLQEKKLNDVTKSFSGYAFPSEWFKEYSGVPTVKMTQITNDWIVNLQNAKYLPMSRKDEFKEFLVRKEDILVALTGATIGNSAIYINKEQSLLNQRVQLIRAKNISSYYLIALLSTKYFKNYVDYLCGGGARQNISPKDVVMFPLLANEISEQVGDIVKSSIQKRQSAQQKYQQAKNLLDKFLNIQESDFVFEKTFSLPFSKIEDRFDSEYYQPLGLFELSMFKKGFVCLGDLVNIQTGKTPPKQTYTKSGVRILKVRDLTNQGVSWEKGRRSFVAPVLFDKNKKARICKEDILLISAAHQAYYIGKEVDIVFNIPKDYGDKLLAVAELLIIRAHNINPYVLLWYLRTKAAYDFIQRFITGETSHLYPKDLKNLPVPKVLLDFSKQKEIESLTKDAILLKQQSKDLLTQAKQKIENFLK